MVCSHLAVEALKGNQSSTWASRATVIISSLAANSIVLHGSPRNRAILSIVGVIGGAVVIFKALKPGPKLYTPDERTDMRGGNADPNAQTDQGTLRSAPRPKPEIKKY